MNFKLLLISAEFLGGIYGNLRILGIGKLGILHFRKTDWHGKAYSGSSPSSAFGQVNWYLQRKSTLWLQNKCPLLRFLVSYCLNLSHHHDVGEVHKYLQKNTLIYANKRLLATMFFAKGSTLSRFIWIYTTTPYIIFCFYLGLLLFNIKLNNLQAWTQATANTGLDCTTCLDRGRRGNHKLAEFAKYPFNFLPVCDNLVTSRGLYLVNTSWPNDDNILTTTLPSE